MPFLFYYEAAEPSESTGRDLLDIVAAVDGVIYLLPAIGQLWEEGENSRGKWSQFMQRAGDGDAEVLRGDNMYLRSHN